MQNDANRKITQKVKLLEESIMTSKDKAQEGSRREYKSISYKIFQAAF
jgi:hypothetical protein